MKRSRRHYVVLTPEGTFLKVPKRVDAEVGQEIAFEEVKKPFLPMALPGKTAMVGGVVAAIVLLAVFLPLLWIPTDAHAETYVYIDLNTSLELGVDKNSQVVEVRAFNPAGEALIQGLDWKGVPINQMVVMVLNRAQEQGYLKPHDRIIVSQVDKQKQDPEVSSKTLDEIKESIGGDPELTQSNVDLYTLPLPDVLKAEAEKTGLSPAKYAVWILAKRNGLDIAVDQLLELSMSEVMEMVDLTPILRNPPSEKEWEEWVKEEKQNEKDQAKSNEDNGDEDLDESDSSPDDSEHEDGDRSEAGQDPDNGETSNSSGNSTKEESKEGSSSSSQPDEDEGESEPTKPESDDSSSDSPSDSESNGSLGPEEGSD
ncbi:anti-sigma factor domain-containing protein [Desmospora profundinema]|uniref:RsgI N-terminal anti-sigma domain-containing protein n=1 Tax=Desmospora profundinema TaxID=1571184 RepID=A0ABU1IMM7_9BACL|nr:anti-sigma factor domain-containing protein [Desmospora profundinema]MDR6226033.1 hypothetical protein [Desmospora profundinema]